MKITKLPLALLALSVPGIAVAQDSTIAGWTFSQFIFGGVPTIDAVGLGPTDHIVATYRDGLALPLPSVVDGTAVGNAGVSIGYDDDSIGSWSFSAFAFDNGTDVVVNELGIQNTINSTTLGGADMSETDVNGRGLGFAAQNVLWDIQVNGASAFTNASGADFTFGAFGVGGAATVEWVFNGTPYTTSDITQNSGQYATYTLDLPTGFYGSGLLQGRLISGNGVFFDNVQINGSAIPEPSSFAVMAGLAGLASVSMRRRRQA